ncbi:putative Activator of lactoyl-CoA dehydratase [Magnetospirillum sp. XM-1]|uniref:acyl-CoA dehydratase activase n=1 Tax=Magnetospirillum sp. XM-1 TaxID=1663591 RepID=UPI00073DCAFF|nr:acyl-CoA dehydratase activase [Magnetospirillum sp. XM-1]CUW39345.1 putative Activator of lactoyl-CoA dehydratase [Magnetospirillum sp. XM-1]
MRYTMGLDIGSTYTKGIILDDSDMIVARTVKQTGSRLQEAAQAVMAETLDLAGLAREEVAYVITTGYGRHQFDDRDIQVTDLTANARGASFLFPRTRTVLDIGGQTMKASRLDDARKVRTFRLNDKCASGTGMFLEKTVRYMGFDTEDIDGLLESATEPASISGVCTVFAESEVINHLSNSVSPENIMFGAGMSLTGRAGQLLKRVKIEEELTLVGGILRWGRIAQAISEELKMEVNVADGDMPQYTAALGCAILGHLRLKTSTGRSPEALSMQAVALRNSQKSCSACGTA